MVLKIVQNIYRSNGQVSFKLCKFCQMFTGPASEIRKKMNIDLYSKM